MNRLCRWEYLAAYPLYALANLIKTWKYLASSYILLVLNGGPTFNVNKIYTTEASNNSQHRRFFN